MKNTPEIINPFNMLATSGLKEVISDQQRMKLLEAAKSLSPDQIEEALRTLLISIQSLQINNEMLREELESLKIYDEFTGLHNRTFIYDRLKEAVSHAKREHACGEILLGRAVLFIDIDGLKPYNDYLGQAAGDAAIKAVGNRMKEVVRKDDLCAHLSGDEFVAVITNRSKFEPFVEQALDRYRSEFENVVFEFNGYIYPVHVSIGAAAIEPSIFVQSDEPLPNERITPTAKALINAAGAHAKTIKRQKGKSRYDSAPASIGMLGPNGETIYYNQDSLPASDFQP